MLMLTYRRDGTYDFTQAPEVTDEMVMWILRGIADQIAAGATLPNL